VIDVADRVVGCSARSGTEVDRRRGLERILAAPTIVEIPAALAVLVEHGGGPVVDGDAGAVELDRHGDEVVVLGVGVSG